jgi:hypothetical protein
MYCNKQNHQVKVNFYWCRVTKASLQLKRKRNAGITPSLPTDSLRQPDRRTNHAAYAGTARAAPFCPIRFFTLT